MGEFQAGKWLILLFIYFTFFVLIVASVNTFDGEISDLNNYNTSVSSEDFQDMNYEFTCEEPRYYYTANAEKDVYDKTARDRLHCSESYGVISNESCNDIEGCSWDFVTTGALWWKESDYYCLGYINSSYYGVDSTTNGRRIASHENRGFWSKINLFNDPSPCTHPNVIYNRTNCIAFSCSWVEFDFSEKLNSPSKIMRVIGDVFTFRHDFGFQNSTVTFLFKFIFLILPLIMLAIMIYLLLPFMH